MNLFGNTGQEKAMQTLIHDTNGSFGVMKYWTDELEKMGGKIQKGEEVDMARFYKALEYIKSQRKRISSVIDNYYVKFQDDFKEK